MGRRKTPLNNPRVEQRGRNREEAGRIVTSGQELSSREKATAGERPVGCLGKRSRAKLPASTCGQAKAALIQQKTSASGGSAGRVGTGFPPPSSRRSSRMCC